jgi:hypothetical protein
MPKFIKHVGVDGKGKKCIVVFREVPGDAENALIVLTEALPTQFHDDLIAAIESTTAQESTEVSEFLFRQKFKDGTNMLNTLHQNGWLVKVTTKSVMMTPQPSVSINLAELNSQLRLINQAPKEAQALADSKNPPGVLSDKQIADKFRSQARTFEAEAKRLREEAEKLDPKDQAVPNLVTVPDEPAKRGRGRPSKVTTAA